MDEGVHEQRLAHGPKLRVGGVVRGRPVALRIRHDGGVEEGPVPRPGLLGGRGVADGVPESPGSRARAPAGIDGPGHLDQKAVAPAKEIRGALSQAPFQGQAPTGYFFPQAVRQPLVAGQFLNRAADGAGSAKGAALLRR